MKYLDRADLEKILPIGRSAIYSMLNRADFPSVRIGKRLLVSEDDLREWLRRGGTEPREEAE